MYKPESSAEAEFLDAYDPAKFPVTVVTVDLIAYTATRVLLIKRGNWPYKGYWALPGGFVDQRETTYEAAMREAKEETGIDNLSQVHFLGIADRPDRDPRARAISIVYTARLPFHPEVTAGDDAAEAKWVEFSALDDYLLAFDHRDILDRWASSGVRR